MSTARRQPGIAGLLVLGALLACGRSFPGIGPFGDYDDEDADDAEVVVRHGSVMVDFQRGDGVLDDPFVGTTAIEVRFEYQTCLIDFYAREPSWRAGGSEGAKVFAPGEAGGEGWQDRLCSLGTIDCDVVAFVQQLDEDRGSFLQVIYAVEGPIENGRLHFGPVPLPELAGCERDAQPLVRVAFNAAVRGLTGVPPGGAPLWQIQKFHPAAAFADQGAAIDVDVEPTD